MDLNKMEEKRSARLALIQRYADGGVRFVDEYTAYIDETVTIGEGTVILSLRDHFWKYQDREKLFHRPELLYQRFCHRRRCRDKKLPDNRKLRRRWYKSRPVCLSEAKQPHRQGM